ncbi:FliO/MopB family protein [Tistrella mobilis]|uniref:FliO/MopB family protein n=1 Tax=Tistrella mobilis TaxID=171437 RepID=UPI0035571583
MTFNDILQMIAGLALVAGLIGLVALAIRRWGDRAGAPARGRRLALVESRQIDPKRRLVLIRRDDVEHLLLIGGDGDLVIERAIETPDMAAAPAPMRGTEPGFRPAAAPVAAHDYADDDDEDEPVLRVDRRGTERRRGFPPQPGRRIPPEFDR